MRKFFLDRMWTASTFNISFRLTDYIYKLFLKFIGKHSRLFDTVFFSIKIEKTTTNFLYIFTKCKNESIHVYLLGPLIPRTDKFCALQILITITVNFNI